MGLFTRLCEAPATSLHPTNEPGPQLGRHIPCFRQAAISQAAKTYVVLEHSCGWSFPAITPFGWEAPVSIHLGRGFLMQAMSWLRRADAVARCTPSSRGDGRRYRQAAGARGVIIRHGVLLATALRSLQQKIGTFKQSRSLPSAYLPFNDGETGRGLVTPGIRTHWHGATFPFRFSVLLEGTRADRKHHQRASNYFSPHSRISFHRYSSAG